MDKTSQGPRSMLTKSEQDENYDLESSEEEDDHGFQKIDISPETSPLSHSPKQSLVIPVTLIENLKIIQTNDHCEVQISLRYGNNFSLYTSVNQGRTPLEKFREQFTKVYSRIKNIHSNLSSVWLKTYSDLNPYIKHVNPIKYKDPAHIVILKIQKFIKGMNTLIEALGFSADFKIVDNLKKTTVKGTEVFQPVICDSYPTQLFIPWYFSPS